MARTTFTSLIRSTGGRPKSVFDARRRRLPTPLLPHNFVATTQVSVTDLGTGTFEFGLLPGNFAIDEIIIMTPATAGTIRIDAPAYDGEAAVNLVAELTAATARGLLTIANRRFHAFGRERPITITGGTGGVGSAAVTGTLTIAFKGIIIDDSRDNR